MRIAVLLLLSVPLYAQVGGGGGGVSGGNTGNVGGGGSLTNANAIVCVAAPAILQECGANNTPATLNSNTSAGTNAFAITQSGTGRALFATRTNNSAVRPVSSILNGGGSDTNPALTLQESLATSPALAVDTTGSISAWVGAILGNGSHVISNASVYGGVSGSTFGVTPTFDWGISRGGADIIDFGNGTAGDTTAGLRAGNYNKWTLTAPTTAATLTAGGDNLTYTLPAYTASISGAIYTWSNAFNLGAQFNAVATSQFAPDTAVTITRLRFHVTTAGATCSTAPVFSIQDTSNGFANLASLTISNGTNDFDSGAISVAVTSGHVLQGAWSTAASGCGTNPSGPSFTMSYR